MTTVMRPGGTDCIGKSRNIFLMNIQKPPRIKNVRTGEKKKKYLSDEMTIGNGQVKREWGVGSIPGMRNSQQKSPEEEKSLAC